MPSSLYDGSSSNGNASSTQYLLMIGWTFVSMYARTFLTTAISSAGRSAANPKKSAFGGGNAFTGFGSFVPVAIFTSPFHERHDTTRQDQGQAKRPAKRAWSGPLPRLGSRDPARIRGGALCSCGGR